MPMGIQEIATVTGLSKSTVSRALRGMSSVADSTIDQVRRVADELGYVPSSAAAGLATGRQRAVGVVVPGVSIAAGDRLEVRVEVTGTSPTTLRAKAWEAGSPEPAGWQTTATDATASLQAPGGVGLSSFLHGTASNGPLTVGYDDLRAGPVG